jgi:hypothetical protein
LPRRPERNDPGSPRGFLSGLVNGRRLSIFTIAFLLAGCPVNSPPLYERDAREFLRERGVAEELITRLTDRGALSADEVVSLLDYDSVAVKHLLGNNLSTPPEVLSMLAANPHFEVRTGVAGNPKTPLPVLLSLRVPGRYDTVNLALSANPMLPQQLLREIHASGEAGVLGLAKNPNLPEDLMREIDSSGDWLAHATLARNPGLPRDLLEKYRVDGNPAVRNSAKVNAQLDPRYRRPQDEMLGGP